MPFCNQISPKMQTRRPVQQGRPQFRRRRSIELRMSQEAHPNKGKTKFLAVIQSSTLALITSLFCAYAWLFTIGVGSSCLTFSLIESAHDTLLSLQREHQMFQDVLEDLRTETQIAMKELEISKRTCLLQDALQEYSFTYPHETTASQCQFDDWVCCWLLSCCS